MQIEAGSNLNTMLTKGVGHFHATLVMNHKAVLSAKRLEVLNELTDRLGGLRSIETTAVFHNLSPQLPVGRGLQLRHGDLKVNRCRLTGNRCDVLMNSSMNRRGN